jgi:hypothetical protein
VYNEFHFVLTVMAAGEDEGVFCFACAAQFALLRDALLRDALLYAARRARRARARRARDSTYQHRRGKRRVEKTPVPHCALHRRRETNKRQLTASGQERCVRLFMR